MLRWVECGCWLGLRGVKGSGWWRAEEFFKGLGQGIGLEEKGMLDR